MTALYARRLDRIAALDGGACLRGGAIGIEREALRASPDGAIAQTPHPPALGAALTHPWITTDYSEAMVELITPPCATGMEALTFLDDLHRYVYLHLGEETLWNASMPCVLGGASSIPIARYGSSNPGRMRHVYRRGLDYRYGRMMQVIAGVHFNYSLPEAFWPIYRDLEGEGGDLRGFRDRHYMGLIRNLQRLGWLVPYLFGASPAVCRTFLAGIPHPLEPFDGDTFYQPGATSLRMGDIGYQNHMEAGHGFRANYDSLDSYVRSLTWAITTPCPRYEEVGVRVNGEWRQLNANVLQIENEHYSSVRPKQAPRWLEKPVHALRERGIGYVELRSLDVNPFEPLGVGGEQVRFLEGLLLFCLLRPSPPIPPREAQAIDRNLSLTAHRGREPGLLLRRGDEAVGLRQWGLEILAAMKPLMAMLDGDDPERPYSRVLGTLRGRLRDPEATPSERLLRHLRETGLSFVEAALELARADAAAFRSRPPGAAMRQRLDRLAEESRRRQAEMEAADDRPFERFLAAYFAGSVLR